MVSLSIWVVAMGAFKVLSLRYVFQVTPSLPIGLYRLTPKDPVAVGDLVLFEVPQRVQSLVYNRGWGLTGVPFFLAKPVVAQAGDEVSVSAAGVRINQRYFGPTKQSDDQGLPLPALNLDLRLMRGQYFAASCADNSFDSRYFGPIDQAAIRGVLTPFITFSQGRLNHGQKKNTTGVKAGGAEAP